MDPAPSYSLKNSYSGRQILTSGLGTRIGGMPGSDRSAENQPSLHTSITHPLQISRLAGQSACYIARRDASVDYTAPVILDKPHLGRPLPTTTATYNLFCPETCPALHPPYPSLDLQNVYGTARNCDRNLSYHSRKRMSATLRLIFRQQYEL